MTEKIEGIVVAIVRHSDRHNVVTLYTRSRGRVSLLCSVGAGRNARLRNARLQLLSVIESDVSFRAGRDLTLLGQFAPARIWRDIYFSPPKMGLLFFLAEFLNRFLKTEGPETLTYDYIVEELQRLDNLRSGVGNFHLSFLIGLLEISGISPDVAQYEKGDWFDMRNAEFTPFRPLHNDRLAPEEARVAAALLRLGRQGIMRLPLDRIRRAAILDSLLRYYSIHFPGLGQLTSMEILRELY